MKNQKNMKYVNIFKEIPFRQLYSGSVLLGSLLLASYFWEVKVIPLVGVEDLLIIILLVSGFGVSLFLGGGLMLMVPGLTWQTAFKNNKTLKNYGRSSTLYLGRSTGAVNRFNGFVSEGYLMLVPMVVGGAVLFAGYILDLNVAIKAIAASLSVFLISYLGFVVVDRKAWSDINVIGFSAINGLIGLVSFFILIAPIFLIFIFIDKNLDEYTSKLGLSLIHISEPTRPY